MDKVTGVSDYGKLEEWNDGRMELNLVKIL